MVANAKSPVTVHCIAGDAGDAKLGGGAITRREISISPLQHCYWSPVMQLLCTTWNYNLYFDFLHCLLSTVLYHDV